MKQSQDFLKNGNGSLVRGIVVLLCLISVFIWITGCDDNIFETIADDSTDEAKLEHAIILMDHKEYEAAFDIFTTLNTENTEIKRLIAEAQSGIAGFDFFNIVDAINDLEGDDDANGFDYIGETLGDENQTLDQGEISDKASGFDSSLNLYEELLEEDPDDETIKAQMALISINRLTLTIAGTILSSSGETSEESTIMLNKSGVSDAYSEVTNEGSVFSGVTTLASINKDLYNIYHGIEAMNSLSGNDDNTTTSELRTFLIEIGYLRIDPVTYEETTNDVESCDIEGYISDTSMCP